MLLFVFFIAIFNLGVGYFLGTGGKLPEGLPEIKLLRKKKKLEDLDDEESLTRPAEEESAEPEPVKAEAPAVKPETADAAPESAASKKKTTAKELMAGLSSLHLKLSEVSTDLTSNLDAPEEFDNCANRLQEANHDYIENAKGAIEQLGELSSAGDKTADAAKQAVTEGCEKAEEIGNEIDSLMDGDLNEESRKKLAAKSAEVVDAVSEACEKATAATNGDAPVAEKDTPNKEEGPAALDQAAIENALNASSPKEEEAEEPKAAEGPNKFDNEFSSEALFQRVTEALDKIEEGNTLLIAETRLDPSEKPLSAPGLIDRVSADLNEVISKELGEGQSFTSEGRRLILLDGDNLDKASHRLETIRQQIEATTYEAGGESALTTITCAMSEISAGLTEEDIHKRLVQTLDEADQLGANKTFHHDGAFTTVVETASLEPKKRVVTV